MWRQIWIKIKTFFFLQWHAREIALHLDDCLRAMGQMSHLKTGERDVMLMSVKIRADLGYRQFKTLPQWKWRQD